MAQQTSSDLQISYDLQTGERNFTKKLMQYDVKDSNPSEKDQNAIFIGASNLNGVMIASHNFFQLFCCNPLAYELFNGKSFDGHIVLNNFWLPMDYREQCMENAEETMWAIGLEEGTIAGLLSQCSGRSPIPKSQDSIDNLQTDAQKQRNKFLANTSTIGNFKAKKDHCVRDFDQCYEWWNLHRFEKHYDYVYSIDNGCS